MRELDVRSNESIVGVLRDANDVWQFEYAASWIAGPSSFDLSPALSRARKLHVDGSSSRPVQWYFDNLLPEEDLRSLVASEARLSAEDAFGLLEYFGAESAGSLILRPPGSASAGREGLQRLHLADLSARISNLPRTSLGKDAPKRMSLAGAQHKLLITLKDGALFEPLQGTPSTHILKPLHPSDDYAASVANEYFTMRLAGALGLETPQVRHMYVPQPVYIIERFDREYLGDGSVGRRHVIDACQLLGKARTFKYSSATVETLAAAILHCRERARARIQLFRWLLFNALAGSADNHLKNISFLVGHAGISCSPSYDLLSTAVYDTQALADDRAKWPGTALALPIGNARRFSELTRADLLEAASMLGLSRSAGERELDSMRQRMPAAADTLLNDCESTFQAQAAASPAPNDASAYLTAELRTLRAIRHVVIGDMVRQLSP